ncbi:MAG: AAA family ATPase, partial [Acidobacteriota bacterium]
MASNRSKVVHVCTECGTAHPKWAGRCSGCGDWNTLVEDVEVETDAPVGASSRPGPAPIGEVRAEHGDPVPTSIPELDRVLGGGLVAGSVTLLGGEPGIGKSTLLLQLLAAWRGPTLYVTAEESAHQVTRRAQRLGATRDDLWLHAETSLPHILDAIERVRPDLVVIDSIQTVADGALGSLPGSVGQVRGCAQRLVEAAKSSGTSIVLVGH